MVPFKEQGVLNNGSLNNQLVYQGVLILKLIPTRLKEASLLHAHSDSVAFPAILVSDRCDTAVRTIHKFRRL